jgi:superfamily I DNA/RNA helicase
MLPLHSSLTRTHTRVSSLRSVRTPLPHFRFIASALRAPSSSSSSGDTTVSAITSRLNSAQKAAVLAPSPGISVCTAGPGSGKTRVLAHRVAYLLHHYKVPPTSVLALTFTNKAGQEMKTRIGSLLNNTELSQHVSVGTFHSFCSKMLRTYGAGVLHQLTGNSSLDRDFTIYDRDDSLRVIKSLLHDKKMGSLLPKDVLQIIAQRKAKEIADQAGSSAATEVNAPKPYSGPNAAMLFKPELEVLYRDYTDSLHRSNALDFDDLLLFGWRLLRDHPDVRRRVQRRYQHVLVDEYQDTNLPQYEIIRMLYCDKYLYHSNSPTPLKPFSIVPNTISSGNGSSTWPSILSSSEYDNNDNSSTHVENNSSSHNISLSSYTTLPRTLFVVGDANQAIYSWRGALPGNMHRIRQDYPSLASLYGLKENYRCSPPIAAAANALLGSNVTISSASSSTNSTSTRQSVVSERRFAPVQVISTRNDVHQANVIADLLNTYAGFGKSRAVLYRTNAQSRQLEVYVSCSAMRMIKLFCIQALDYYPRLH